ncbi:Transmembrane protein 2 [Mizuhopecten yessoensis]|uniref:Transmembrane protein 2 n=2 Tax=Mizuhopecten yessoensis TaxID=6573 RepID=A0A210PR53_MIZYE|nr:Transmembrane protein 2 [Mizuhopecten yessoensis]
MVYLLRSLTAAIFCLQFLLTAGQSWCPHEDPFLKLWSDVDGTWAGQVFDEDSNVTVSGDVLLDMDIDVFSITIVSGASLVWSPAAEPLVRVRYIEVHGSLIIGSEDCPYTNYTLISFVGAPGSYSVPDFNEKFLGVAAGGTLEVHGEERIGWTKLDKTLEKCSPGDCIYFEQKTDMSITVLPKYQPGLVVTVMDENTGLPLSHIFLRLDSNKQSNVNAKVTSLRNFMNGVQDGRVVAMAIQRYLPSTDTLVIEASGLFDYIEILAEGNITNQMEIRNVEKYDAYSLAFIQGGNEKDETLRKAAPEQEDAWSVINKNGICFKAQSYVDQGDIRKSFVNVMSANASRIEFVLDLVDDVSLWRQGDVVLVTSTDFDWRQAELADVIECEDCLANQIKVNMLPKYTHYGEVYMNTDMRAEVALISRNIVFEGSDKDAGDDDVFGGHLKFLQDFENVHIEGAEFFDMGQNNFLGRYPIHFHLCGDVDLMPNPPYIRSNSIHNTYARCITIHGTNGVKIERNVCFDSLGHGYFLEDGDERRNVFDGNLGLGQRSSSLIPTDSNPVTFFITNPDTYLRNNVAAGGLRAGYWFVFTNTPIVTPASADVGPISPPGESKHTAISEFYNNVAHSYTQTGLLIDSILKPDGKTSANNLYEPLKDPLNPGSGPKEVKLLRYTGYKNRLWNAYVSGGYITLEECSFSDSSQSVYFERGSFQWKSVTKSVFLGESPNTGEPTTVSNRSRPIEKDPNSIVQGFVFNEGPIRLMQSWFGDFDENGNYKTMGIGFQPNDNNAISPRSSVEEVLFGYNDPADLRVFDGNASTPGYTDTAIDRVSAFVDKDGSLTTQAENTVLKPIPFHLTDSCIINDHWGLGVCPQSYGQLSVSYSGNAIATMTRDDDPSLSYSEDSQNGAQFLVIKGFETSYILNFDSPMPNIFTIKASAIDKVGGVRIGVCVPRNAKLELKINKPKKANKIRKWSKANSLQEVDDDTNGAKYFFDDTVGIVFFKLFHSITLNKQAARDCPKGVCTAVTVKIKSGDKTDSDCTARAYAVYNRTVSFPPPTVASFPPFNLDMVSPPEVWGAGPTRHGMFGIPSDVFD